MWMYLMMTNIKNNSGGFIFRQSNPCEQFVFFKYHFVKLFLISLDLCRKNNNVYVVVHFIKCMAEYFLWQTLL